MNQQPWFGAAWVVTAVLVSAVLILVIRAVRERALRQLRRDAEIRRRVASAMYQQVAPEAVSESRERVREVLERWDTLLPRGESRTDESPAERAAWFRANGYPELARDVEEFEGRGTRS